MIPPTLQEFIEKIQARKRYLNDHGIKLHVERRGRKPKPLMLEDIEAAEFDPDDERLPVMSLDEEAEESENEVNI